MSESRVGGGPSSAVTGQPGDQAGPPRLCSCGVWFRPVKWNQRFCHSKEADRAYNAAHPVARQRALPLVPAPAPLPPVVDQRVPAPERPRLRRMSRLILERVQRGPAKASELHAMFPGARSVRTRISEVGRHVGPAWRSAPGRGVVGEWVYWLEATP